MIAAAVEQGLVTEGIMHALVTNNVPFVLAGSIRDDGPLPEVVFVWKQALDRGFFPKEEKPRGHPS